VIFICDFDPVGLKKYRYTKRQTFYEDESYAYDDGEHTIYLSTKGENNSEVSEQLVKFLHFVGANLAESTDDFEDALVKRLQDSVARIKASREMGERYMLFEELLKDEYSAGKAEGIAEGKAEGIAEGIAEGEAYGIVAGKIEDITELLSDIGTVSESLHVKLCSFTDAEQLRGLVKLAARTESVEAFEAELDSLLK
jgi:hypothetical protein